MWPVAICCTLVESRHRRAGSEFGERQVLGARVTAATGKRGVAELADRMLAFSLPTGIHVAAKRVGVITSCLRKAVMKRTPDPLPPEISGHDAENRQHVAYLPLLDAGFPHSGGDITGVAVLSPPGRTDLAELISSALTTGPAFQLELGDARLRLRAHPMATDLARWAGPSHTWTTVTPMVLDRFPGKGNEAAEIKRACVRAGLPEPVSVRTAHTPFVQGAADLGPRDFPRRETPPRPYTHAELTFATQLQGPILLGSQRYLGMGVFMATTAWG